MMSADRATMLPGVPGRGQLREVGKTVLVLRQHAGKSNQRNWCRLYTRFGQQLLM